MGIQIPSIAILIVRILTACALVIAAVADIYFLSQSEYGWEIKAGFEPKYVGANIMFYVNISVLIWCIFCLLFAVLEIGLCTGIAFFGKFNFLYLKGISYILLGIAHLGVCGDLGIAAGSLLLIFGVVSLLLDIFATSSD